MTSMTRELVTGFSESAAYLEKSEDEFAQYLDEQDIEPSEAGVIIEEMKCGDF